jgi:hypothetical protein
MANIAGVAAGLKHEGITKMLELYYDEVTHARYRAKPKPPEISKTDDAAARLARVAALSSD